VTRYVEERRDAFGVEPVCRAIGVPVSTYYARRSRKPSRRELDVGPDNVVHLGEPGEWWFAAE
jgi:hypothetical protein